VGVIIVVLAGAARLYEVHPDTVERAILLGLGLDSLVYAESCGLCIGLGPKYFDVFNIAQALAFTIV
jgi:hypothetical protein